MTIFSTQLSISKPVAVYLAGPGGSTSGAALADEERLELLNRSLAGEHVEIEIEILASIEPDKPLPLPASMAELANANFSRFHKTGLSGFVRSFKNKRFLRDHNQRQLDGAGGLLVSSVPRVADDGSREFVQRARLVKPWAVQGVLDGTITEFSIGWHPRGGGIAGIVQAVQCSVCRCSLLSMDCPHMPGDVVELADGDESVIVEALWMSRNVVGVETSAVLFPAVAGTGIESVGAELSKLKQGIQMEKIFKALGLSEDATRDDALEAIKALREAPAKSSDSKSAQQLAAAKAAGEQVEAMLEAEREAHGATKAELQRLRDEAEQARAARELAEVEALVQGALDSGRVQARTDADGKPVESAVVRGIRTVASTSGLEAAREYVESLPVLHPIGTEPQSKKPAPSGERGDGDDLSEFAKAMCQQLGITPAQFRAADKLSEQAPRATE